LTRIGQDDFDDMLGMYREAHVARALGGTPPDGEIAALVEKLAQQWDAHGFGWWTVRDPGTGRFMGRGGLRQVKIDDASEVEVGYALLPEFWNRGLATELARVSVAQGFVRLALAEVVSLTPPTNHGSRRVMEKTGLCYERELAHAGMQHVLYRLTSASWRAGLPAAAGPHTRPAEELVAG
jgi:RimJ/RimL family protein N-acetyltransferase